MDPKKEQHQILCKSWKKCDGDHGNDNTNVRGRKYELYVESPNSLGPRKVRQVKSKFKSILIILLDIKDIIHKEFVLAGQTLNSAYFFIFKGCIYHY
jgi:hypothetical protein